MKHNLFLMLFLSVVSLGYAQREITGKVTDQADIPLAGVSVIIKGTLKGASTDFDGNFVIEAEEGQELTFSYLGFLSKTLPVGSSSTINVVLQDDVQGLDEVVVVGFGTEKKVNLSGAVSNVSTEDLDTRPISNVTQGLQGVSPGLNIDFNSGAPGADPIVNIRGFTSINGGDPLIIIDGVPSDVSLLNLIAPEDIESISVLKDASSAAIYGARAAFGVLLITTKTGGSDKMSIRYNTYVTVGTPTVVPNKTSDPYIYLALQKLAEDNTPWTGIGTSDERLIWARERSDNPTGTVGVRESINNPGLWEYMGNKNWENYFLGNNTYSQNHNLSFTGGSEKVNYYISASSNKHNGSLKIAEDYFTRTGIKSKINANLTDWLSLGNNTSYLVSKRKNPSYFNMQTLYNFAPTDWDKNPDGSWANTGVGSMGAQLTEGGDEVERINTFQTTFNAQAWILKDVLKVNAEYTFQKENENYEAYYAKYNIGYGPDDVREVGVNEVWKDLGDEQYQVFNAFATYKDTFGDHALTLLGGYNQEEYRYDYVDLMREGVISSSLPTLQLATGTLFGNQYIRSWSLRGLFYRANYIYKDRYIVELNGRYDGSSKFPEDKRYGFFPSVSGAWNISKENFMESLYPTVNLLKLRASYGSLGNQDVGPFDYIPSMSSSLGNYIIDGELPLQIGSPAIVSSNYTWEEVVSKNIGVDLGLFNNKFNATMDYFIRDTKGMLTQGKDLPGVLGASEPNENAGDLRTKGWELSLTFRERFGNPNKPLNFSARFNLSDSKSTITKFDNPNNSLLQYYEGMEIGEIWGLTSDGLFTSQAEIDALDQTSIIPWGALDIVEGWPKYVDLDGNQSIEKGLTVDEPKDLKVIGNMLPRLRFGLNLDFNWNNFDLGVFLQGVGKRDYYPRDYLYWGFYQQPYSGGYTHLQDFYRPTDDNGNHSQSYIDAGLASANTDSKYPVYQAWLADRNLGERIDQTQGLSIPQTAYLLDGSYLRLKNITFGYTIPSKYTDKIGVTSLRLYFSGDNLFEWSEIADFFDPEAVSDINSRINPAYSAGRGETSGYQYPYQRKYSFGINVNF
ncbi:TonB-dependent receptor [Arenibacter sp. F20364]|uniref:SusC/RagA family TonB-linked outer membrane protein n=1 Tax=Arenibacter sp. F20364 TaxID=2926415 RepID=UPI001FF5809D|nr:TonB-dependent receptor [Arenibacter sp. F20364]MCK0191700.1 TonB-dependent receptor [Arenibacter sp. F20364]